MTVDIDRIRRRLQEALQKKEMGYAYYGPQVLVDMQVLMDHIDSLDHEITELSFELTDEQGGSLEED